MGSPTGVQVAVGEEGRAQRAGPGCHQWQEAAGRPSAGGRGCLGGRGVRGCHGPRRGTVLGGRVRGSHCPCAAKRRREAGIVRHDARAGVPRGRPRSGRGSKQFSPSGGEASARRKAPVEGAAARTAPRAPPPRSSCLPARKAKATPGVGSCRRGAVQGSASGWAAARASSLEPERRRATSRAHLRSAAPCSARPGRSPDPKMSARPPIACPPPARCFGFHRSAAAPPRPPLRLRAGVRTTNPVRPRGLLAPSGRENYNSRLATGDFKGGGGVFRGRRGVAGARPMYGYSFRRSVPCEFWDL